MSIFLNKICPSSSGASAVYVIILSSTFPSYSIASCFSVYLVALFTNGILNPFIVSLNEKLNIAMNFRILWGVSVTRFIFECVGGLSIIYSHDMSLHWFLAYFLPPFLLLILHLVSSLLDEGIYVL